MKEVCDFCHKSHPSVCPYGPGRSNICIDCAKGDKEKWAIAQMYAVEAAQERNNVMVISLTPLQHDPETCPDCIVERERNKHHAN
jgi:hypothetical protein